MGSDVIDVLASRLRRISELEAQLAAAKETWRCYHCGFETADRAEAEAHFGDRDDAEEFKPLCRWWANMSPEERGEALQDTIKELNSERDENAVLRSTIEGLEYRVNGIVSEIKSFSPFRDCESIHQVFHVYDSMEGRMLVAEEKLAAQSAQLQAAREALEPFAKHADFYDAIAGGIFDEDSFCSAVGGSGWRHRVTVGDLRNCRKALAALDGEVR